MTRLFNYYSWWYVCIITSVLFPQTISNYIFLTLLNCNKGKVLYTSSTCVVNTWCNTQWAILILYTGYTHWVYLSMYSSYSLMHTELKTVNFELIRLNTHFNTSDSFILLFFWLKIRLNLDRIWMLIFALIIIIDDFFLDFLNVVLSTHCVWIYEIHSAIRSLIG